MKGRACKLKKIKRICLNYFVFLDAVSHNNDHDPEDEDRADSFMEVRMACSQQSCQNELLRPHCLVAVTLIKEFLISCPSPNC